ncbi:hypothetical protein PILCRDRAFT_327918 [Piloderma croceum F 1598]|uniref:F-box domain-containing protein n=1 Tax=Piloderma croceum (strain F 1598) TaxID=765440 RepID=A0A0C3G745_PILCF|nr:hypothetical protein PILCRDRAFT_327918 [Piloderma croceum F 1598]
MDTGKMTDETVEDARIARVGQATSLRSLPNELLSFVFEHCYLLSRADPPIEIVLSHLNRQFRAVAVNTRMLWARIDVFLTTHFDQVLAYLHRSGTLAFDLFFNIHTNPAGAQSEYDQESRFFLYNSTRWTLIMSHMIRCRRLTVRFDDNGTKILHELVASLRTVRAPLLQSLQVETPYDIGDYFLGPYLNILGEVAPSLTAVRIVGWGLHQCLPPLTTVTSLTLLWASRLMLWSDLRSILSGSLSLSCLVLGDIFAGYLPSNLESSIILPSLRQLGILVNSRDGSPFVDDVLFAISAPVLEVLYIDNAIEVDLVNLPQSYPQLQNPNRFPHLRHVIVRLLSGQEISQQTWSGFFSVFPRVAHFALLSYAQHAIQFESLIGLLALKSEDRVNFTGPITSVPELISLSFNNMTVSAAMLLCDLVSSRAAAGHPLTSLRLPANILHEETFADSLNILRTLVEVRAYQ